MGPQTKTLDEILAEDDALWGGTTFLIDSKAKQADLERKDADILAGLNPQQLEAVEAVSGPVQIVAGAGTGKTRTLTARVAHIVASGLAEPREVLGVTFTNKAAAEMRERIVGLVGDDGRKVRMGSFHAVSLVMLRHHARAAGLMNDRFSIIDEADQSAIVESVASDLGYDEDASSRRPTWSGRKENKQRTDYLRRHKERLLSWKEEGWTVEDLESGSVSKVDLADPEIARTVEMYKAYQEALAARNACDYADLILHMVRLFRKDESVRAYWASKFKYVLVDEFQDTNPLQYEWLWQLAKDHGNLCVVGDLDQCIYQWRSARPEIFSGFADRWPGCKIVTIDRNYRSTQEILDVANRIVAGGAQVGAKKLNSPISGAPVAFEIHQSHLDEARAVSDRIQELAAGGHKLSEIAVLVRSAGPMRTFEERFLLAGVPYTVVGGQKFFEREEVKDALAYLRLAVDPRDEAAFLRIIDKPGRSVGEQTALKVVAEHRNGASDLAVACRDVAASGVGVAQEARAALERLADLIDEFAEMARDGAKASDLLLHMLGRVAYISWRVQQGDDAAGDKEESLKDLCQGAEEAADAASYLQNLALLTAADVKETAEAVRISTIHAAKGLEFDTVFTPCMEEGILPNAKSMGTSYGLEEEKRIAHVGWTRPRKNLHVSCARTRAFQPTTPSSFLIEAGLLSAEALPPKTASADANRPKPAGTTFLRRRSF